MDMEENKRNSRLLERVVLWSLMLWVTFFYYADTEFPEMRDFNYEISIILFSIYTVIISSKYKVVFYWLIGGMIYNIIDVLIFIDFNIRGFLQITVLLAVITYTIAWYKRRQMAAKMD